jgi:hypothetical protein
VTYQTDLFLEKNRDYIIAEHQNLLSSSKCSFISCLFASQQDDPSKSSYKFSSVASRFKVSLAHYCLLLLDPNSFVPNVYWIFMTLFTVLRSSVFVLLTLVLHICIWPFCNNKRKQEIKSCVYFKIQYFMCICLNSCSVPVCVHGCVCVCLSGCLCALGNSGLKV